MKKENQKEQSKELITSMIKPGTSRVLLELIRESSEYLPGITRVNPEIEPYLLCHAVSPEITNIQPGDYVITRNMGKAGYEAFSLWGRDYCILYASDVAAVITKEVCSEIKNQLQKTNEEVN